MEVTELNGINGFDEINTLPPVPLSSPADARLSDIAARGIKIEPSLPKSLDGRVTLLPATPLEKEISLLENAQKEIATSNEILSVEKFDRVLPNAAFEMIKLGIAKEQEIHGRINQHLEEGQKLRGQIHDLLDLSSALTKMPLDAKEFSPKAKELLEKLKKEGIDLGISSLSKEKILELKSEVSGQVDRLRSDVNILLSTKVNYLTQTLLPALLEMMKKAAQENKEAISRINERMGR